MLVTRLPFATRLLYSWDSVNFAEGMRGLDITRHAPHPPGYPYYVALARAVDTVLGDPNASLVLISIVFAALAVVATYCYGRLAFDEATGVVAALSLVGSLTFWAYGTVALSYTVLAFFST
ncbi:MAG: glycosyltransferase family 39 protein, partial [Chloroflexota bacterium]|nr:glycosyltransferase family 39 protein [Chloroflexota bacterium]